MKEKMQRIIKRESLYPVYSFIVCAMLFICILKLENMLGVNNQSIIRSDLFAQYIPYITNFWSCIKGEASLWYSFSNYLGSGNILNVAYYAINPFNVLFLFDFFSMEVVITILITCKLSLSSALFQYFAQKNISNNKFNIIISLFYGLSGYAIIIHYNIMWLDILYVLPILIHFIISFIKSGRYIGLVLAYAYIFITNFYMSYIAGIFSALFFVMYLLYINDYKFKGKLKKYILVCIKFVGIVLLAASICAIVLFSTVGFLYSHIAADNNAFEPLNITLLDILNTMYIGQFATSNNIAPYLYCGIPVLGLVIFFFISKRIDLKLKASLGIALAIYIVSMLWLPMYSFMHAFDYPNFNAFRFAYIVVFICCVIACITIKAIDFDSRIIFKRIVVFLVVFYSFMFSFQNLLGGPYKTNTQNGLILNALFMLLWYAVIHYITKEDARKKYVIAFVVFVSLGEILVNAHVLFNKMDLTNMGDNEFNQWYYSEKEAIQNIKAGDDDFYRVYVEDEWSYNAASLFNYNSLNTFSSSDNFELRRALSLLGESVSNREIETHTLLPAFDSLFAVKYRVDLPKYYLWKDENINEDNYLSASVSINQTALGLGYMVNESILNYQFETNCFNNINNLCSAMTGKEIQLYRAINDADINTLNLNFFEDANGILFYPQSTGAQAGYAQFDIEGDYDNVYAYFYSFDPEAYGNSPLISSAEDGMVTNTYLTMGGAYKCIEEDGAHNILIYSEDGAALEYRVEGVFFATYDNEAFNEVFADLKDNQLEIYENSSDYILGKVIATEDKNVLFTSIPYDPEWYVFVDGQPTTIYRVIGDAFMAIPLTPGEHVIEFRYIEKYSNIGAMVSFGSICIFALLAIINVLRKNRK